MDFLREADEAIQREVFFAVANLFNLEVDVLLFDTTSTYFETEDDDDFPRYGHSKGHRPDRPQTVIGVALTKEGIPVRCWSIPGNARLVSALLDRLTHRCHVLQFQAESYRFRESLAARTVAPAPRAGRRTVPVASASTPSGG